MVGTEDQCLCIYCLASLCVFCSFFILFHPVHCYLLFFVYGFVLSFYYLLTETVYNARQPWSAMLKKKFDLITIVLLIVYSCSGLYFIFPRMPLCCSVV